MYSKSLIKKNSTVEETIEYLSPKFEEKEKNNIKFGRNRW